MTILKKLVTFLVCLSLAFGGALAAGDPQTDPSIAATCEDVQTALKKIKENNEGAVNPLMTMMPKADCWLERTQQVIEEFDIDQIIPPVAIALGLMSFASSILGAMASGVPRKLMDATVAGVLGGIILTFSIPTTAGGRSPVSNLLMSTWIETYTIVGTRAAEQTNGKINEALGAAAKIIAMSPIGLVAGGAPLKAASAIYGATAFVGAVDGASTAIGDKIEANKELATMKTRLVEAKKILNTPLPAMMDPAQRAINLAERDRLVKSLEQAIAAKESTITSTHAGGVSIVDSEEARKQAEDQAKRVAETSAKTSNSLSIGFLMVMPMLLTYAGAIYASGVTALMMGLAFPMVGVAVIMGQGQILMTFLMRHIANVMVVAILPIAFIIAIEIAYIQPMIAMKGMYASAGLGEASKLAYESWATANENMKNFNILTNAISGITSYFSAGLNMLKLNIIAMLVGLFMMLGSIGIGTAMILKLPGILSGFMDSAFSSLGGASANPVIQSLQNTLGIGGGRTGKSIASYGERAQSARTQVTATAGQAANLGRGVGRRIRSFVGRGI